MCIHHDSYILAHLLIPNLCFSFRNKLYQIHNQYQYKCNNMNVICNKLSLYKIRKALTYIYPTVSFTLMPIFIFCIIYLSVLICQIGIIILHFCLRLSGTVLLPHNAPSKETYLLEQLFQPYIPSSSNTSNLFPK